MSFASKKELKDYTIFVSIASFNDRWLQQTVDSAISKASNPNRVFFGVWEQRIDSRFILDSAGNKNIRHVKLTFPRMLGVGLARTGAFSLYKDEDFILQIDAHMIFADDWDNKLISNYYHVSQDTRNKKIIFTNYLSSWWHPQKDGSKFFSYTQKSEYIEFLSYNVKRDAQMVTELELDNFLQHKTKHGLFIVQVDNKYKAVAKFWDQINQSVFDNKDEAVTWLHAINDINWEPIPQQHGSGIRKDAIDKDYLEHTGFSGHFVFTIASFITDVAPDPFIIFMGEEHTTALRAWTRGYRMYGIGDLILWHLNKDGLDDPEDRNNLEIEEDLKRDLGHRNMVSLERSRDILTGAIIGYWGAPSQVLLEEYEKASNFNFKDFYTRVDKNEKK